MSVTLVKTPAGTSTLEELVAVPAGTLLAALAGVIPSAGTVDTLPVLTGVLFTVTDDGERSTLELATTDRYTMSSARIELEARTVPGSWILPAKALKTAATALKKECKHGGTVRLERHTAGDRVDRVTVSGPSTATTLQTIEGEFPKYRTLLEGARENARTATPPAQYGVNATYFARFAAYSPRLSALRVTPTGDNRPFLIEPAGESDTAAGVEFVGLVMPVRLQDR